MQIRKVDGGICAECKRPVGLVTVNGKSVEVEAEAVIWDDVIVIKLHCCPRPPGGDGEKPKGPKAGRKVRR